MIIYMEKYGAIFPLLTFMIKKNIMILLIMNERKRGTDPCTEKILTDG